MRLGEAEASPATGLSDENQLGIGDEGTQASLGAEGNQMICRLAPTDTLPGRMILV